MGRKTKEMILDALFHKGDGANGNGVRFALIECLGDRDRGVEDGGEGVKKG